MHPSWKDLCTDLDHVHVYWCRPVTLWARRQAVTRQAVPQIPYRVRQPSPRQRGLYTVPNQKQSLKLEGRLQSRKSPGMDTKAHTTTCCRHGDVELTRTAQSLLKTFALKVWSQKTCTKILPSVLRTSLAETASMTSIKHLNFIWLIVLNLETISQMLPCSASPLFCNNRLRRSEVVLCSVYYSQLIIVRHIRHILHKVHIWLRILTIAGSTTFQPPRTQVVLICHVKAQTTQTS